MAFRQFHDRTEAGQELGKALSAYAGKKDTLILALPRGGVPVAEGVAKALSLPMDVWIVRKLGVPEHKELAMGAVSMGGICHVNNNIMAHYHVSDADVLQVIADERQELTRRNKLYRHDRSAPDLKNKTVIIVDDGMATGSTMHAAVLSLRDAQAQRIVVAVPVAAAPACAALQDIADEVICLHVPEPFLGVGQWYEDFLQTSDDEVLEILNSRKEAHI